MAASTSGKHFDSDLTHEERDETLRRAIDRYEQNERPQGLLGWLIAMVAALAIAFVAIGLGTHPRVSVHRPHHQLLRRNYIGLPGTYLPVAPIASPGSRSRE